MSAAVVYDAVVVSMAREYLKLSRQLLREGYNQFLDAERTELHHQLSQCLGLDYWSVSGDEIAEQILGVKI